MGNKNQAGLLYAWFSGEMQLNESHKNMLKWLYSQIKIENTMHILWDIVYKPKTDT